MTTTGPTNGNLIIHGGTPFDQEAIDRYVTLAGGPSANFVYIPTALADNQIPAINGATFQLNGFPPGTVFPPATVLHTRDRAEADSESFVELIKNATGVFIGGGRQPRLADSYLNTRTHHELQNLLDRGGVIAGSSAGAMIMSDFLVRGDGRPPDLDNTIMIGDHTEGFGFVKNIAFDVHLNQNRDADLVDVLNVHPQLLGIGIDEVTAIHVHGDEFEVIGPGRVLIRDGATPVQTLSAGDKFDMRKRTPV